MASKQMEIVLSQFQQLSPDEQLELIKRVTEVLNNGRESGEHRQLIYAEFKAAHGRESTEEDFKLAEWRPTKEWLNGE
jgi:uncharacterized protein YoaH (UPF0181 family)